MTALHHAAALGDVESLAMIIERDGLRMLEQQDRVRSLSRDQVCVVVPACWSSWVGLCVCVPQCGSTPLHHAALLNHPQAVKFLLEKGANINAQKTVRSVAILPRLVMRAHAGWSSPSFDPGCNQNGRTCLHEAAWIGHMDILEVLMEAHADPEILEAVSGLCGTLPRCVAVGTDWVPPHARTNARAHRTTALQSSLRE